MMGLNLIFLDESDKVIVDAVINDEIVDAIGKVFFHFDIGGIDFGEKSKLSKIETVEMINSLIVEAEKSDCTVYTISKELSYPATMTGASCMIDGTPCLIIGGKNECLLKRRILGKDGSVIDTIDVDIRHKEYIDTDNIGRCKIIRKTAGRSEVRQLLNKIKKTLMKRKEESFYIVIA